MSRRQTSLARKPGRKLDYRGAGEFRLLREGRMEVKCFEIFQEGFMRGGAS